jgi:broad specificity phosphatase PhoE
MSEEGLSNVYIIRHGERMDHIDPEWKKTAETPEDPPLSENGIKQAHLTGKKLNELLDKTKKTKIFASPLYRCLQTATGIAEELDLPITAEEGLSEWIKTEWFSKIPDFQFDKFKRVKKPEKYYFQDLKFPETERPLVMK